MTNISASAATTLKALNPAYAETPLHDLPVLARRLGVTQVLAKDETGRFLGSFKSLGGTYAGLRVLARTAGISVAELLKTQPSSQPPLICASDGNHGLAVAAAARLAGASARVYLHTGVPQARARRISDQGAEIIWVYGTYDDAVDQAADVAAQGMGILVADTATDPADPIVQDVMAGYGVMADEIRDHVESKGLPRPTHVFVQAGVGGLAAAIAEGLAGWMDAPGLVIAVEPETATCLAPALAQGHAIRIAGDLHSAAEMLSCGEASAPALAILQRHNTQTISVSEDNLTEAPRVLAASGGPPTTASGAAGLAGALRAVDNKENAEKLSLGEGSRVLILITERAL